ncbi:SRPBCC family protein [Salibacterium sp. K-3]
MFRGTFQYQTLLPANRDEVWQFFNDPANLEKLTDAGGATVKQEGESGDELRIDAWISGIKVVWNAFITERRQPEYFVDEAVSPPFPLRRWRHHHSFQTLERFTGVTDHVTFESWIPVWVIKLGLKWMFTNRRRELLKIFS